MSDEGIQHVIAPMFTGTYGHTEGVAFVDQGGAVELRCKYALEAGVRMTTFSFERVRAYRHRAESHCTLWHFDYAYSTLVEVRPSAWVDELLAAQPDGVSWRWPIRHFLIYVEDEGAYEVAAESCEWLADQPV